MTAKTRQRFPFLFIAFVVWLVLSSTRQQEDESSNDVSFHKGIGKMLPCAEAAEETSTNTGVEEETTTSNETASSSSKEDATAPEPSSTAEPNLSDSSFNGSKAVDESDEKQTNNNSNTTKAEKSSSSRKRRRSSVFSLQRQRRKMLHATVHQILQQHMKNTRTRKQHRNFFEDELDLDMILLQEPDDEKEEAEEQVGNHRRGNQTVMNMAQQEKEDDRSLLDCFGESAKEILTQHVIPPTDEACRWHWKHLRCESHCLCSLHFRWGDYHLGRSCRFRSRTHALQHQSSSPHSHDDNNNGVDGNQESAEPQQEGGGEEVQLEWWEGMSTCHLPPTTPLPQAISRASDQINHIAFTVTTWTSLAHDKLLQHGTASSQKVKQAWGWSRETWEHSLEDWKKMWNQWRQARGVGGGGGKWSRQGVCRWLISRRDGRLALQTYTPEKGVGEKDGDGVDMSTTHVDLTQDLSQESPSVENNNDEEKVSHGGGGGFSLGEGVLRFRRGVHKIQNRTMDVALGLEDKMLQVVCGQDHLREKGSRKVEKMDQADGAFDEVEIGMGKIFSAVTVNESTMEMHSEQNQDADEGGQVLPPTLAQE